MGERETPALISKAFEAQTRAQSRAQEREQVSQEAPAIAKRLRTLIQTVVPNPELDTENFYASERVSVEFGYPVNDQSGTTVGVRIEAPAYPRDRDDIPHYYDIYVGEGELTRRTQVVISGGLLKHHYSGDLEHRKDTIVPFNKRDLVNFKELLQGLEDGVGDGSIRWVVWKPEPYAKTGHLIEKLADEALHTG